MKRSYKVLIALSVALIGVGIGGTVYAAGSQTYQYRSDSGMMGNSEWNTNSGMMGNSEWNPNNGMMGNSEWNTKNGMMGRQYKWTDESSDENINESTDAITAEEAYNIANEYVKQSDDDTLSLGQIYEGNRNVYLFELISNGKEAGILHVSRLTGDVWFVDCPRL
ncbi:MAG: hypothetical protein ACK5ML_11150 [Lachnospiraceae bacterium]